MSIDKDKANKNSSTVSNSDDNASVSVENNWTAYWKSFNQVFWMKGMP